MSEKGETKSAAVQKSTRKFRTQSVVDRSFQLRVTFQLLSVLAGTALLYFVAIVLLPGREAIEALTAEQTRVLLLRANLIYFGLAACILFVLSLILTHRIAGPARVMLEAVDGLRRNETHHRLDLRDRDYFKPLASSLALLREDVVLERAAVRDISRCIEEGDLDGAREILARLGAVAKQRDQILA